MVLLSKRYHYPRCLSIVRTGGNAPSCSVFPTSLLKDNYGRLIDFLSQISKLSYFNLLDLADFLMHTGITSFPFRCLMWQPGCALIQPHTCACKMCIISSFVIHWQFRRIDHNGSHKPISVLPPSSCTYNSHITKERNVYLRTSCTFSILV